MSCNSEKKIVLHDLDSVVEMGIHKIIIYFTILLYEKVLLQDSGSGSGLFDLYP